MSHDSTSEICEEWENLMSTLSPNGAEFLYSFAQKGLGVLKFEVIIRFFSRLKSSLYSLVTLNCQGSLPGKSSSLYLMLLIFSISVMLLFSYHTWLLDLEEQTDSLFPCYEAPLLSWIQEFSRNILGEDP